MSYGAVRTDRVSPPQKMLFNTLLTQPYVDRGSSCEGSTVRLDVVEVQLVMEVAFFHFERRFHKQFC